MNCPEKILATTIIPANNVGVLVTSSAKLTPFNQFERTPLLTYYLQRDYRGQNESYWHLCNEPYDYAPASVKYAKSAPATFELAQNYPNPFNPATTIQFALPKSGHVRLEIYNIHGQIVDLIVDGYFNAGSHRVLWQAYGFPTGTYYYRCLYSGYSKTGKMVYVK